MARNIVHDGLLTALLGLSLLACPAPGSTQQPPDAGPASGGEGSAGAPDEGGEEGAEAPVGEGSGGAPAAGRQGPKLPEGPLCDTNADCGEGQVCEGPGCEAGKGRCVDAERICTRDLATYCGCDGAEFQSSGTCPGARFAYRGPCEPALEEGEPCTDGRQCRSGQCVGEGLEGCSTGAQGVCGRADCTQDLVTYCGCNGTEFATSGTCPNRQFAYRGPCEGT